MSTVTAAVVEAVLRVTGAAAFQQAMSRADQQTKKVEQSAKSLSDRLDKIGQAASLVGRGLSVSLTAPLLAVGTAAVKTATDMDALRQGLVKVTGSSAEAERQLARLKVIAKQPGLGFEEAIKGSLRLQSAGLSAKQAEGSLREFGNAIAAAGGGKAELDGVTLALSQIASKGKVSAEEINQLSERFYGVREAMKRAFGTSDTEILQAAKLTTSEFVDTMVEVLSQDRRVGNSLKNQFETAQDDIKESLSKLGQAIAPRVADALGKITSVVARLADAFDRLPKGRQDLLVDLGIAALAAGPALSAIGAVGTLASNLKNLGVSLSVLATVGKGGIVALATALSFAPHVEAFLEGKQLREQAQAQDATLPPYIVTRGHIAQLREFQQSKKRYPGHSPVINPNDELGKALAAAGLGGDATAEQIDAAIVRMGRQSRQQWGALRAQTKAVSPLEAQRKVEEAQAKAQKAILDAQARADRLKAEKEAREEAAREAERRRKEKEDNDRRFREAAAQRVKDAQDRLAGISLSSLAQKQREARRQFQEDQYYGVPGADNLLRLTLQSNAIDEVRNQIGGFSFSGALSAGFGGLNKLGQKRRESLEASLKSLNKGASGDFAGIASSLQSTLTTLNKQLAENRKFQQKRQMAGIEGAETSYQGTIASIGETVKSIQSKSLRRRAGLFAYRAAQDAGNIAEAGFLDLVNGRNVLGNALERVKGAVFQGIGEEIGRGVERQLRKRLANVFEEAVSGRLGKKLGESLDASLKGINASAGAILSGAYSLIAALSRRRQLGLGSILGGIGGFLLGGPMGALQGYNIGNALDNRDWGGAIIGGLSTQIQTGGAGGGTPTTPADGRAARTGPTIIVQHYGDINGIEDLEGASQRQGRAIERALSFNG